MKKFSLGCLGVLVLIMLVGGCSVMTDYNSIVTKQNAVDAKWAQVQNVYQRRSDLIPNLVNTVQGAAAFEKSTLVEVTNARASVGRVTLDASKAPDDAAKLQQFQEAQGQLSNALSRLMVVSERYPELKANANFQTLQAQLEGTENRISVERRNFNEAVQDYNTSIMVFPNNLLANFFGFKPKPWFQADEAAQRLSLENGAINYEGETVRPSPGGTLNPTQTAPVKRAKSGVPRNWLINLQRDISMTLATIPDRPSASAGK